MSSNGMHFLFQSFFSFQCVVSTPRLNHCVTGLLCKFDTIKRLYKGFQLHVVYKMVASNNRLFQLPSSIVWFFFN